VERLLAVGLIALLMAVSGEPREPPPIDCRKQGKGMLDLLLITVKPSMGVVQKEQESWYES